MILIDSHSYPFIKLTPIQMKRKNRNSIPIGINVHFLFVYFYE